MTIKSITVRVGSIGDFTLKTSEARQLHADLSRLFQSPVVLQVERAPTADTTYKLDWPTITECWFQPADPAQGELFPVGGTD